MDAAEQPKIAANLTVVFKVVKLAFADIAESIMLLQLGPS